MLMPCSQRYKSGRFTKQFCHLHSVSKPTDSGISSAAIGVVVDLRLGRNQKPGTPVSCVFGLAHNSLVSSDFSVRHAEVESG